MGGVKEVLALLGIIVVIGPVGIDRYKGGVKLDLDHGNASFFSNCRDALSIAHGERKSNRPQ